jgi:cellulose biosynthesis protein BcsQ
MKTFDEIIPEITAVLQNFTDKLDKAGTIIINRDLNGRVRLIADDTVSEEGKTTVAAIAQHIANALGARVPTERIFYEQSLDAALQEIPHYSLDSDFPNVVVADRLLTEANWSSISPVSSGVPRVIFYSIKGGVGRSTALAIAAWALAEQGKKVMVLDMDLESPGLSSSLLPKDRMPTYGIVDWLIEDLVDNGDAVFPFMAAISDISRDGEIRVVPAYGDEPGEYVSKIGRAWMPKYIVYDNRELWHKRLNRLLDKLEAQYKPDVVLIDSRAGLDEISAACITGLGASSILLFALDSAQTWDGYNILFNSWLKGEAVSEIRERLQVVGALIPELNPDEYINQFTEQSWDLFRENLYEAIPPEKPEDEKFSFDKDDNVAPHYPRIIRWNRGFAALSNLYQPLQQQGVKDQIQGIFGNFIEYIKYTVGIMENG